MARIESESIPSSDVPSAVHRALHHYSIARSRACRVLRPGTKALDLVDPVVSQEVGLFWAEGETVMPMASALVEIVKEV